MNNLYIIKDRLNEAMKLRGLNITELASRTGLNKSTVSRYLTGAVIPRTPQIGSMAKALDVSPTWILGYNVTMSGAEIMEIDTSKLSDRNREKLFVYYQALLDSQEEVK